MEIMSEETGQPLEPHRGKHLSAARVRSVVGYAWFMTGGALFALPIFLAGYALNVTLVAAPVATRVYRMGLFVSTMGQPPPGGDRPKKSGTTDEKKPFVERIRPYTPPGFVERRGKPVPVPVRAIWFVLVGWLLGAIWVGLAWSLLLLPYPLLAAIRSMLDDLPSVMTLALPASAPRPAVAGPS